MDEIAGVGSLDELSQQGHLAESDDPTEDLIDPDPFTIALGIFGAIAGGGAFLETRRQRQFMERQQQEAFRGAYFSCRRTLIHFQRLVDEFETYVKEDGYGDMKFRIGVVRLSVGRERHRAMRRLNGQAMLTASHMSDDLDELSNFLSEEDQPTVDEILSRLSEMNIPDRYIDVLLLAREAIGFYTRLLDEVRERESFESSS